jgi:uroporphyrinogen III methyltransferase/synthase
MGVKNLPDITKQLVANGRAPDTPVAVIQQGTSAEQRTVTGTLTDIVDVVEKAGIKPPAVTVVGEVVRLRKNLAWFAETGGRLAENRPLYGKRVLITRTRRQASILARLLAAEGAIPVELPTIEIAPLCDGAALKAAIERLRDGAYAWTGFTSANAVEVFFDALSAAGLDARAFGPSRVFAIGPATARALAEHGITADVVPDEYFAEAIVAALRPHLSNGERVFLPRAESAREELVQGLETLGASLDEVPLYRTLTPGRRNPSPCSATARSTSSPSPRPPPSATWPRCWGARSCWNGPSSPASAR